MQVKKFEAKSMKEALQLVKQELGPEAIILSAKDNKRSFGLAGRGSVEVTAAISEKSLQKKKYVEKNLPEGAVEKFRSQSAKRQKEFIEDSMAKFSSRSTMPTSPAANARLTALSNGTGALSRRPMTSQRYIDIGDEEPTSQTPEQPLKGRRVDDILEDFAKKGSFILEEASGAALKKQALASAAQAQAAAAASRAAQVNAINSETQEEVTSLRSEVESLRQLLSQFGREQAARHPGAEFGLPFELSATFEKLQGAGIDSRFVVEILQKANEELSPIEKKKSSLVDAWVARYVLSHTYVTGSWMKSTMGCQAHLFMGPAGHGKTTTLVKVASHLALQEKKKVAVVTADTFKVAASDQLRIYCQILNLPFETLKHSAEFPKIMQRYSSFDIVLVDYPGFSLKEMQEIDQIRSLMPAREIPKQTHLILSCGTKDVDAYEACHRYQVTHFDDLIVTKIDESFIHGFLYNIQRKTEKPLHSFGIGSKIPEDIELATRERVVDLIYKLTKTNK